MSKLGKILASMGVLIGCGIVVTTSIIAAGIVKGNNDIITLNEVDYPTSALYGHGDAMDFTAGAGMSNTLERSYNDPESEDPAERDKQIQITKGDDFSINKSHILNVRPIYFYTFSYDVQATSSRTNHFHYVKASLDKIDDQNFEFAVKDTVSPEGSSPYSETVVYYGNPKNNGVATAYQLSGFEYIGTAYTVHFGTDSL
ncbi:hypothetical protein FACS189459_5910 [Bacilli bacterium]|nr:hypothetical protein FACS189459_5910 [Bacilli bacterium]